MKASLGLIEDHPFFSRGLRTLIESERTLELRWNAASLAEGRSMLVSDPVDVLILDLKLRDGHGFDALRDCLRTDSSTRVLVVTAFDSHRVAKSALDLGAYAFFSKTAPIEEVLEALRLAAKQEPLRSESQRKLRNFPTFSPLTERESDIMKLVARGLTNKLIGAALKVSTSTVKTYVERLFIKLEVNSRAALATEAWKLGLLIAEEDEHLTSA